MAFFSCVRSNSLKSKPNLSSSSQLPPNYHANTNQPPLYNQNFPIIRKLHTHHLIYHKLKVNAFSIATLIPFTFTCLRLLHSQVTKQLSLLNAIAIRSTINKLQVLAPQRSLLLAKKVGFKLRWPYCAALLAAVCILRVERVPFSGRYHLVFVVPKLLRETLGGDKASRRDLEEFKGEVLPPTHPMSVRAVSMLRDVAQAMHDVLGLKQHCTIRAYAPLDYQYGRGDHILNNSTSTSTTATKSATSTLNEDTRDQVIRVVSNMSETKLSRHRFSTKHLEGRDWKMVVIDSYRRICEIHLHTSNIIISTELLDSSSDAELAFSLGHELGHAIGQHHKDGYLCILTASGILLGIGRIVGPPAPQFIYYDTMVKAKLLDLFYKFFSRRRELEADHIGMMLMAAAGYDPQIAPKSFREDDWDSDISDIFSTHPINLDRARFLEKPKRMKPALDLYRASKGVISSHTV